jgi:hypothetical protein
MGMCVLVEYTRQLVVAVLLIDGRMRIHKVTNHQEFRTIDMSQSDDIRSQIAAAAITWADENELEHSKDERKPKYESAFKHRVNQSDALQRIKSLVRELHSLEGDINAEG